MGRWRQTNRTRCVVGALGVLASCIIGSIVLSAPATGTPDAAFTWAMAERFGTDLDGDGMIDYPTAEQVVSEGFLKPTTWPVRLDVCDAPAVLDRQDLQFDWVLDGTSVFQGPTTDCAPTVDASSLGSHTVSLVITDGQGQFVADHSETIVLRDHLIVSIGDSIASGEGVADKLEYNADGGGIGPFDWSVSSFHAKWQEEACHRSALAGPAQAARRLEKRDPHSSVTFVHLACSGAEMTEGLMEPYGGVKPIEGQKYRPQVDVLADINARRPVDAVTMSIGANDLQFAKIVEVCLYTAECHTASFIPAELGGKNAEQLFDERIGLLPGRYQTLQQKFAGMGIGPGKIHVTEYYNPSFKTTASPGNDGYCDGNSEEETAANRSTHNAVVDGLSHGEYRWADLTMMSGLNAEVKNAATTHGWKFVDGIAAEFKKGHGYCARDRWVRTLFESIIYQGDLKGPFHPNVDGHLLGYGVKIEDALAASFGITAPPIDIESDRANAAIGGAAGWLGVLDGLDVDEELTAFEPWGAVHDKSRQFIRWALSTAAAVQQGWADVAAAPGQTLLRMDNALDDLDEDGDRTRDFVTPEGVVVDIEGAIEPHLPSPTYEVLLTMRLTPPAGATSIDLTPFGLTGTKPVGAGQEIVLELPLRVDTGFDPAHPAGIRAIAKPNHAVARARTSTALDLGAKSILVGGDQPALTTTVGLFEARVTGTVEGMIEFGVPLADADGDGYVTKSQLDAANALDDMSVLFADPRCTAGRAKVDLALTTNVPGLRQLGSVKLDDDDGCDGFQPPDIDLADDDDVGVREVLDALHRLYRSLRSAHKAKDPALPMVDKRTSDVVDPAKPLEDFFRKQKLLDRTGDKLDYDREKRPDLDTLPELLEKLSRELKQKDRRLGLGWDPTTRRLSFRIAATVDPPEKAVSYQLDTGELLADKGLVDLNGTVGGSADALLKLDLGIVIDLMNAETTGIDRVFLDTSGTEVEIDAHLKANLDIAGNLGPATVNVTDGISGSVAVLGRADPAYPMLAVDLSPRANNPTGHLLPLSKVLGADFHTDVRLRAQVPATKLVATAKAGTVNLATGECMVAWPEVANPSTFVSGCDGAFLDNVRPFAGVHDPVAFLRTLLGAFRTAVTTVEDGLGRQVATTEVLPVVGTSVDDITTMLADVRKGIDGVLAADVNQTLLELEQSTEARLGSALGVPKSRQASLLTFSYSPATRGRGGQPAAPPALNLAIDLGVCTSGRDANNDGDRDGDGTTDARCTYRIPAASAPFTMRLGLDDGAPVLAGLTSEGSVTVNFDGYARFAVGLELPAVVVDPAGELSLSGEVQPFIHRSTRFELGAAADARATFSGILGPVTVSAGTSADPVKGCIRLRTTFAAPDGPSRVYVGDIGAYIDQLAEAGTSSLSESVPGYQSTCTYGAMGVPRPTTQTSGEPQAAAKAPVYVTVGSNVDHLGTATFAGPKVFDPSTWKVNDGGIPARLTDVGRFKWRVLHDGLVRLLDTVEEELSNPDLQQSVPLIGDDLDGGAQIVDRINTNLVEPLGPLAAELDSFAYTDSLEARLEERLNTWLGPTGANILVSSGAMAARADLVLLCQTTSQGLQPCAAGTPTETVSRAELLLPFGQSATITNSRAVDLGFPGLQLNVPATTPTGAANTMSTTVGWNFDLKVGIDRTESFYVSTAATKDAAGNDQPELRLEARANLPQHIEAQIAFIPLTLTDLDPGNETIGTEGIRQTDAWAGIGIDFKGGYQNRLPVRELTSITRENFELAVGACVGIQSDLVTKRDVAGNNTGLPVLGTTLKITGGFDCPSGRVLGAEATELRIVFEDVELDLGSWISDFLRPAADEVNKALEPIRPAIEAVQKPIPGVEEAAKIAQLPAPTWMDAFRVYAELQEMPGDSGENFVSRVVQMADIAIAVNNAAQQVSAGQNLTMPVGTFTIHVDEAGRTSATADSLFAGRSGVSQGIVEGLRALGDAEGGEPIRQLVAKLETSEEFFTFPAFEDPSQFFLLLLGKDPTLVQFNGGVVKAEAVVELKYPIGPASIGIEGRASLDARFVAGFDTYGIRQALKNMTDGDVSNDGVLSTAAALLQGLYLEDKIGSEDPPEIVLDASIAVVASVGVPGLSVDAVGGIYANVHADLAAAGDRMRYPEIYEKVVNSASPLCMFNAGGTLTADLRLRFTNPVETWDHVIASKVLIDTPNVLQFCNKTTYPSHENPVGSLRTVDGEQVLTVKTKDDKPNRIRIGTLDTGSVYDTTYVSGPFGTFKWDSDIDRVVITGGRQDDDIVVVEPPTSGFRTPRFDYLVVNGNGGNDRVQGADGLFKLIFDGGDGHDLLSSNGPTDFAGGAGDDKALLGCNCSGAIDGGPGDDHFTIVSHNGPSIEGGDGWDTVDYGYYDHKWLGDLTLDLANPASNAPKHIEAIIASPYNDTILGTDAGERVDGGAGNDTIRGHGGDDQISGGPGNDHLVGGVGSDLVYGDDGDDILENLAGGTDDREDYYFGGAGVDTIDYRPTLGPATQPGVTIRVDGEANDGGFGENDFLGADLERFYGSNAGGSITTSSGNDWISTPAGVHTVVNAGAGTDYIEGAGILAGGTGNDSIYALSPSILRGDEGPDKLYGSTGNDILEGGTGDDYLEARGGDDQLWGKRAPITGGGFATKPIDLETSDNDQLRGGTGADHLNGGPGADDIYPADDLSSDALDTVDLSNETKPIRIHSNSNANGTSDDWVAGLNRGDYYQFTTKLVFKTGSGNDDLKGDAEFWGGDGDDRIEGTGNYTFPRKLVGGRGADTVLGAGTASYEDHRASQPVTVTLGAGPDDGNPDFDRSTDGTRLDDVRVRNVVGSAGADTLTGDAEGNRLDGGEGYDRLHGLGGFDIVSYESLSRGVLVTVGVEGGEDFFGPDIEQIIGSPHADVLDGSGSSVPVWLLGAGGNDTLVGSDFDDELTGGDGDDTLDGGIGADRLIGGVGMNTLDSDTGIDTLDYTGRTEGVWVDLTSPYAHGGAYARGQFQLPKMLEGDIFFEIEHVRGGAGDDLIVGNGADNILDGGAGDDELRGNSGEDHLIGGAGRDVLAGGRDRDTYDDSASDHTAIDLEGLADDNTPGVVLDMDNLGALPDDEVWPPHVDELRGTNGHDELRGPSDRPFTLRGGLGNDTLIGGPYDDVLDPGFDFNTDRFLGLVDGAGGNDTIEFAREDLKYGVCVDLLTDTFRIAQERNRPRDFGQYRTCDDISVDTPTVKAADYYNVVSIENVTGTDGSDVLLGNDGPNDIHGLAGDDFIDGRPGDDVEQGGPGFDWHFQGFGLNGADTIGPSGADTTRPTDPNGTEPEGPIGGGIPDDTVDYRGRASGAVSVTFDGVADDGQANEGDNVLNPFQVLEPTLLADVRPSIEIKEAASVRGELPVLVHNDGATAAHDVYVVIDLRRPVEVLEHARFVDQQTGTPLSADCVRPELVELFECVIPIVDVGQVAELTLIADFDLGDSDFTVSVNTSTDESDDANNVFTTTVRVKPSYTFTIEEGTNREAPSNSGQYLQLYIVPSDLGAWDPEPGTIDIRVTGEGTATYDHDFPGAAFPAQKPFQDVIEFNLKLFKEGLQEGDETFEIEVSDPDGVSFPTTYTIVIQDADIPTLTLVATGLDPSTFAGREPVTGDPSSGQIDFELCSDTALSELYFEVVGSGATATPNVDIDLTKEYNIEAGNCRAFEIPILADGVKEPVEYLDVQLKPLGYAGFINSPVIRLYIHDA